MTDPRPRKTAARKRTRKAVPKKKAAKAGDVVESQDQTPERVFAFADAVNENAQRSDSDEGPEQRMETWITFGLASEIFAFPVTAAQEVVRVGTITRVPHAPFPVRGIVNLRGQVVPVVDLRVRLGLPPTETGWQSRILITQIRNRRLGLLVDSAEQVVRLDRNTVEAPPSDVMTEQSEYIIGVCRMGDDIVILLEVERVLLIPDALQPTTVSKE
jgi:purine-binding chemotaxis protein CheW